jgi:prolyl 4-hydroxylase
MPSNKNRESRTYIIIGIVVVLVLIALAFWGGCAYKTCKMPKPVEWKSDPAMVYAKTQDGHGVVIEVISDDPKIMLLHNFLSPQECDTLIKLGEEGGMPRSTVQGHGNELSGDRTSHTTNLKRGQHEDVKRIEKRVTAFSGLPPSHTEPLQIVRYHKGQQYKAHYDFFVPGAKGTDRALKRGGQRQVTFFCYLNDVPDDETGSHTEFPKLGVKVKPKKGLAVYWMNVTPDKKEDFRTLHSGNPPKNPNTTKYGCNIWCREKPFA